VNSRFALTLLCTFGASLASLAADAYFPLWQKNPPNTTDMVLIYQGGRQRPAWSPEELAPYVSATDPRDSKEKWLFDGFLFIEFVNGKKHALEEGLHLLAADKGDWLDLLDRNFESGHGTEALEKTCAETEARIGKPLRARQVVLTLPEPIEGATNWGTLNGHNLNFSNSTDRVAASTWFITNALARWEKLNPKHLHLAGFYFVPERTLGSNSKFLAEIAKEIHRRGLTFYWIPYWQARGAAQWKEHGFDVAWQQPNHFFHPEVPDTRIKQACEFARKNGMGMEFEMDGRLISKPETFAPRFEAYLNIFESEGAKTNASITYYEGGNGVLQLARSKDPNVHKHYDRLAEWIIDRQQLADKQSRN
jgi:hypothetical protein